jgi:hypothetical protein
MRSFSESFFVGAAAADSAGEADGRGPSDFASGFVGATPIDPRRAADCEKPFVSVIFDVAVNDAVPPNTRVGRNCSDAPLASVLPGGREIAAFSDRVNLSDEEKSDVDLKRSLAVPVGVWLCVGEGVLLTVGLGVLLTVGLGLLLTVGLGLLLAVGVGLMLCLQRDNGNPA